MAALDTHVMRQTSHADNVSQIEAIVGCIRRKHPAAPIVFTVSPIPLLFPLKNSEVEDLRRRNPGILVIAAAK